MAGIRDAIDIEDARGIAEFMVMAGRIPSVDQWADGSIDQQKTQAIEGLF